MSRFLIDAEISIGDGPRFTTTFVVTAPNEDTAFDAAHDYLTEGGWWGEHGTLEEERDETLIVHDLALRQVTPEQLARALTEARVSPRKRGAR
jgi:hypothetical protein